MLVTRQAENFSSTCRGFEKCASETFFTSAATQKSYTETLRLNFNAAAQGIRGKYILYSPHSILCTLKGNIFLSGV